MLEPFFIAPLGALAVGFLVVLHGEAIHRWVIAVISFLINQVLLLQHPIYSVDGQRQIPTVPYQWPNGQGDIGKFLEGVENSLVWGKGKGKVYRIWSGMAPEIVLASPSHLRSIFQDSSQHSKALNNDSGWLMSQILGECVGLVSKDKWRKIRSAIDPPFTHSATSSYVSRVQQRIEGYMARLESQVDFQNGLLDPAGDMKMLPFLAVAEIIYGGLSTNMEEELSALATLREELFRYVIQGGLPRYSWSQFLPTQANRALCAFKPTWADFNDHAVQRARSLSLGAPIEEMFRAVETGMITAEQLYQTLDESLFANLDVTTGAISWCIVFLSSSLQTQQRVRDEVEAAQEADTLEGYLLESGSFLAACILEASRLKPLAAFSVPQSAPTERVVDDFLIPAGTNFIVDAYAINVRDEFWGPDSHIYRPERFLNLAAKDLRYHFWRFGFGSRQCMGKYVADLLLRSLLAYLITHYDISLLDKDTEWQRDPHTWITHPKMKLRCVKRKDDKKMM